MAQLIERDAELERLDAGLAGVSDGAGCVIVVEGPAGIGKTRLVEEARERAARAGLRTLAARGDEWERDFPFGMARQLFERELATADPARREALLAGAAAPAGNALGMDGAPPLEPGGDIGFPVLHALYWLAANLAAEAPLLLVVDDTQWADAPSARLIAYLAPRVPELPLALLVASRPPEPGDDAHLAARLASLPHAVPLRPAGLSREATASLLAERLGTTPEAQFTETCWSATGGNPFLLRELAGAVMADGITPDADGADRVRDLGPATVSRSLLLRVARDAPAAPRMATAIAILGENAELRHAAALAEVGETDAAAAADALAAAGVLAPVRPLAFIHGIVRAAVSGEIGPGERDRLHARAAELLRDDGAEPERLVPHLLAVEPAGRDWAFAALRDAAQSAMTRGAPDVAVACLRRALAEGAPSDFDRGMALAVLGLAELCGGDDVEAGLADLEAAVPLAPDPGMRTAMRLGLIRATWFFAELPDPIAALDAALADVPEGDETALARLEGDRFALAILDHRTCERAEALLEPVPPPGEDDLRSRLICANHAVLRLMRADNADAAADLATRALGDGALLESEGSGAPPYQEALYALALAGRVDQGRPHFDAALRKARAEGKPDDLFAALANRAMLNWYAGDLSACEADAQEAADLSEIAHMYGSGLMWLVLSKLERDDLEAAALAVERTPRRDQVPDLAIRNPALWACGVLRLAQGRPAEALEELDELARRSERLGTGSPNAPWRPAAVEAHLGLGDRERARQLAREDEERARRWGAPATVGAGLRARAMAEAGDDGIDLLRQALGVLEPSSARLEHARAVADLGGALRRSGHRAEAREVLRDAVEAARACGATALARRTHEELKLAGAKPRRLQFSGVEALTAAERRVAELAAEGMSNKEIAQALFVTAKTVENQLGRVYMKLGIGSRRELAPALAAG